MRPLWPQLHELQQLVEKMVASNKTLWENGFHLIGHSQGGLLTRSLLESWTGHKCHTYISMAGVQMGQYGVGALNKWVPAVTDELATDLLYTQWWQENFSGANFWHSPLEPKKFLSDQIYLPIISNLVRSQNTTLYKANFLKVKKVVLLGSPQDGTLVPWFTSHFAFWDEKMQEVPRVKQAVYTDDTFGLKTLEREGRLVAHTVEGVKHGAWLSNRTSFDAFILPELY
jgi:palmitoyl-protein thioesterase